MSPELRFAKPPADSAKAKVNRSDPGEGGARHRRGNGNGNGFRPAGKKNRSETPLPEFQEQRQKAAGAAGNDAT